MEEIKDNQIVVQLKCEECDKVCGTLTFPIGTMVDVVAINEAHLTYCDEHVPE